jgi:hypothetical protein
VHRPCAAACLLALLVAGCRTPAPIGQPLSADDPRPAALLDRLVASMDSLQTLRGRTRVSIDGRGGSAFSRQLLVLARPAQLRLEILGMLGQRVAILATDGVRYDLFRAETHGLETGDVHGAILWEVAGLPLTPEEAVELAFGTPVGESPRVGRASEVPGDGGIRVDLEASTGAVFATLEFAAEGQLARYVRLDLSGAAVLDARYGDYRDVGGRSFAHRIEVDFPVAETRAEIRFQSVELNPELPEQLFRLELRGAEPDLKAPGVSVPWSPSAS